MRPTWLALIPTLYAVRVAHAASDCTDSAVELTWLGVTMYHVSYTYQGRRVKILLDDQISKPWISKVFDETLGDEGSLDYIFISHMHFDHDGACPLSNHVGPAYYCAPFYDQAANYSAHVVAPTRGCNMVQNNQPGTECTTLLPNAEGPQVLNFSEIGLRVTAVPSAHSENLARGKPDCHPSALSLACPDAFSYVFAFPGEEGCGSSMFWQGSAHTSKPYLEGHSEEGLNYSSLLRTSVAPLPLAAGSGQRTTLMLFPGAFLDDEAPWREWAAIVRPAFHTNHHHGLENPFAKDGGEYWPELNVPFLGDPMGGKLGNPAASWLANATVPAIDGEAAYNPKFLGLADYFDTFRIVGPSLVEKVDRGYAAKFRATAQSLGRTAQFV